MTLVFEINLHKWLPCRPNSEYLIELCLEGNNHPRSRDNRAALTDSSRGVAHFCLLGSVSPILVVSAFRILLLPSTHAIIRNRL